MKQIVGIIEVENGFPVRLDSAGTEVEFRVDPYLLSDGVSLEAPLPVTFTDQNYYVDTAGNLRVVWPVNIVEPPIDWDWQTFALTAGTDGVQWVGYSDGGATRPQPAFGSINRQPTPVTTLLALYDDTNSGVYLAVFAGDFVDQLDGLQISFGGFVMTAFEIELIDGNTWLRFTGLPGDLTAGATYEVEFGWDLNVWTPTDLFADGQTGHWPGGYDPALGRMWQDSAGVTPVTAAGQPVGLVSRAAGTADASQPTALSRPTLARWPKGGRRNLLTWTEDLTQASWTATGAIVTTNKVVATASNSQHRVDQVSRLAAGRQVLTVDMRAAGYTYAGLRLGTIGAAFNLSNGDIGDLSPGVEAACEYVGDSVWRCSIAIDAGQADAIVRINTATTMDKSNTFIGDGVSGTEVIRAQATNGEYPYQRVTTQYDITEAGVPDVWHLSNDGGDSLPITLPAGTYGRARVNAAGLVTVDTVVDPADALVSNQQVDVILRQGAFTPEEEANIRTYWARYAA